AYCSWTPPNQPFSMALRCLGNPGRITLKGAHVFRTPFNPTAFCDQVFKAAVLAAGIPDSAEASGISFIDASDI
ncbi:imm11 family protein, partial [Xanthomonas euvesicatoria]|uniref:imm11 family protein n=1 Tax=Xanthomonas euvesicatoria TaxID=456327 RepID=UPI001EB6AFD6|nr:hypothetical protein [Xanthomonas campestris pv. heliotropii]